MYQNRITCSVFLICFFDLFFVARYAPSLLKSFIKMGPQGALGATKLLRPFLEIVDSLELKDPFIRNWIDLLAFLLAGVKSDGILSAEMVTRISIFIGGTR